MSSLQNSLAIVGGLTLVGVVLYNLWTARQNAPRQASSDNAGSGTDPTLDSNVELKGPQDPSFLDDAMATWRHKHVITVERIIGGKRGTGGTAGVSYLSSTLSKRAFPELWSLRTQL